MCNEKHILYCILDWGLGHASRSVPIIKCLQEKGYYVTVATSEQLFSEYLSLELKHVGFLKLKPYAPSYSSGKRQNMKLLSQLPNFFRVFISDYFIVSKFIKSKAVVALFSDNRFSCWNKSVKSFYVTHQLNVLNARATQKSIIPSFIHKSIIKKYSLCLVPDVENGISELLSDYNKSSIKIKRIGLLSRFKEPKTNQNGTFVLAILSGPEPQRSLFENRIIEEARHCPHDIVLVRGSNMSPTAHFPSNIKVYNIVSISELEHLINACIYVVSRSGYSTIMDLIIKRVPAVLVPTPGQAEQVYLAKLLQKKTWFLSQDQEVFKFLSTHECSGLITPPVMKALNLEKVLDEILYAHR